MSSLKAALVGECQNINVDYLRPTSLTVSRTISVKGDRFEQYLDRVIHYSLVPFQ